MLLSGCRRGEALGLTWSDVDLRATDRDGRQVGLIHLRAAITKTHRARTVGLEVSPALLRLLSALHDRPNRGSHVFGGIQPYTADLVEPARDRLIAHFGAPQFSWQLLRSTASSYITCSDIFGNATHFLAAKQLGHSMQAAERHYAGTIRDIPRDARTLEAAMRIGEAVERVIAAAEGRG